VISPLVDPGPAVHVHGPVEDGMQVPVLEHTSPVGQFAHPAPAVPHSLLVWLA
jgi:hypothetical protein